MEKLYDIWIKRDPQWETRHEDIIKVFCDYGKGMTNRHSDKGLTFGAGYELFIIAFFIGLYADKTLPIDPENSKKFGWAIQNWGNGEARGKRTPYPKLREYMFAALIARTDIDLIALDKGEESERKIVDQLIDKMEGYANYGFEYLEQVMSDNNGALFKEMGFLDIFMEFAEKKRNDNNSTDDDELEEL